MSILYLKLMKIQLNNFLNKSSILKTGYKMVEFLNLKIEIKQI